MGNEWGMNSGWTHCLGRHTRVPCGDRRHRACGTLHGAGVLLARHPLHETRKLLWTPTTLAGTALGPPESQALFLSHRFHTRVPCRAPW